LREIPVVNWPLLEFCKAKEQLLKYIFRGGRSRVVVSWPSLSSSVPVEEVNVPTIDPLEVGDGHQGVCFKGGGQGLENVWGECLCFAGGLWGESILEEED
jgi:hypothetical protein